VLVHASRRLTRRWCLAGVFLAFCPALCSTACVDRCPVATDVLEADHIAQLFQQVTACEQVLVGMQDMLQGFRSNLGGISQEIKSLQSDSITMNVKLDNRRAVHARLTTFLDKVAVSEEMILILCEVRGGPQGVAACAVCGCGMTV
jgi:hypothetical protein